MVATPAKTTILSALLPASVCVFLFSIQLIAIHSAQAESLPEKPECVQRLAELSVLARSPNTALVIYENLATDCPQSADAHYAFGVALKKLTRLVEAKREFARALEIKDSVAYRVTLGVVAFELGSVDEAAQLFARASELDPRSVSALQGSAWVAAQQSDFKKALELIERALAIDNNNADLLFNRAALAERMKNYPQAQADYERVTSLDSSQVVAWCRLGMLRFAGADKEGAIAPLTQCVKQGGVKQGGVKQGGGTESDSGQASSEEIAVQVKEGAVFLARALGATGELERAEITLRRMLEKNPNDVALKVSLAETYIRMQRFDEAMATARAATLLNSSDPRTWSALGQAALGLGDNAQAETALSKARGLSGDDKDPTLLNNLGVLQLRLGRKEESRTLFEAALKIDQQFEAARNNLKSIE